MSSSSQSQHVRNSSPGVKLVGISPEDSILPLKNQVYDSIIGAWTTPEINYTVAASPTRVLASCAPEDITMAIRHFLHRIYFANSLDIECYGTESPLH
jgi:hypothetical protein